MRLNPWRLASCLTFLRRWKRAASLTAGRSLYCTPFAAKFWTGTKRLNNCTSDFLDQFTSKRAKIWSLQHSLSSSCRSRRKGLSQRRTWTISSGRWSCTTQSSSMMRACRRICKKLASPTLTYRMRKGCNFLRNTYIDCPFSAASTKINWPNSTSARSRWWKERRVP